MYIKISEESQLVILRNLNPFLGKYKIPAEVLYKLSNILESEFHDKRDYIALFLHPLKNDTTEILDDLKIYPLKAEFSDDVFHCITVKNKKKTVWNWCNINVEDDRSRIFVVYSMRKKDLLRV